MALQRHRGCVRGAGPRLQAELRRRVAGRSPANSRGSGPICPDHVRRRVPGQLRHCLSDPRATRRPGHVLPRHRAHRRASRPVVGRAVLDDPPEPARRAAARAVAPRAALARGPARPPGRAAPARRDPLPRGARRPGPDPRLAGRGDGLGALRRRGRPRALDDLGHGPGDAPRGDELRRAHRSPRQALAPPPRGAGRGDRHLRAARRGGDRRARDRVRVPVRQADIVQRGYPELPPRRRHRVRVQLLRRTPDDGRVGPVRAAPGRHGARRRPGRHRRDERDPPVVRAAVARAVPRSRPAEGPPCAPAHGGEASGHGG